MNAKDTVEVVTTALAVESGEWIMPDPQQGFLWGCCDCGLFHSVDFRVVDGHVEFRVYRDEYATWARRMRMAFEVHEARNEEAIPPVAP